MLGQFPLQIFKVQIYTHKKEKGKKYAMHGS